MSQPPDAGDAVLVYVLSASRLAARGGSVHAFECCAGTRLVVCGDDDVQFETAMLLDCLEDAGHLVALSDAEGDDYRSWLICRPIPF